MGWELKQKPGTFRVTRGLAIIGSYKKNKSVAHEFWTAVRDETGVKPDLPDRRLAKFLTTTVANNGSHVGAPARFRIASREYFVKCIKCWNAWRKGEAIEQMRYSPSDKIPAFV